VFSVQDQASIKNDKRLNTKRKTLLLLFPVLFLRKIQFIIIFTCMNNRESAEHIFIAGIRGVLPDKLVNSQMSLHDSVLRIAGNDFSLNEIANIYVIGAGKASAAMAHYVENILVDRITDGQITVKYGHACKLKKIRVTEAGHPLPDSNGFKATREIIRIAQSASENDLVIGLFSGGGSALLTDVPEGLLPEEVVLINNLLIRSGASIHEINTIRKHLSNVKGGQLARAIWPARSVNIILSDVIGNQLDIIASGPTVPDTSTFSEALKILEDYQLMNDITDGIINYLSEGAAGNKPETPKPDDPLFSRTINVLAGTNLTALEAARKKAIDLGFTPFIINDSLQGDVAEISQYLVDTALYYMDNNEIEKPVCLLFGGETTLKVTGNGLGGRNQHLALIIAMKLQNIQGITVLAAGTDGSDGPTEATGAVIDSDTMHLALSLNADPERFLNEFDSFHFFKKTGGHIITGPTMTNVMDMIVIIVD